MTITQILKDYSAYIIAVGGFLFVAIRDRLGISKAFRKAIQALCRDRLKQGHRYFTERGYASYDDKTNYENLYIAYHGLGKNGVMTQCYNEVMALPAEPKKKA